MGEKWTPLSDSAQAGIGLRYQSLSTERASQNRPPRAGFASSWCCLWCGAGVICAFLVQAPDRVGWRWVGRNTVFFSASCYHFLQTA
jgi:hypothetical protein